MPAVEPPVHELLAAVKRLPPDALAEFTMRLAEWQESTDDDGPPDAFLVRQTELRMPAADAQRLGELAGRSERENLDPSELEEYRMLARKAERINVLRVRALAELTRRRDQPVHKVKRDVGWQESEHGA